MAVVADLHIIQQSTIVLVFGGSVHSPSVMNSIGDWMHVEYIVFNNESSKDTKSLGKRQGHKETQVEQVVKRQNRKS